MLVYGFLLAAGAAQGNGNFLQPLSFSTKTCENTASFAPVKNVSELQAAFAQAKIRQKPVLVDFYASWCVSCREMENTTFKDAAVIAALNNFVVLKADITANDARNKALMQQFQVIAPPTFLLFDAEGRQLKNLTRVGKMDAREFLDYLRSVRN